jgi:hypothetical protein
MIAEHIANPFGIDTYELISGLTPKTERAAAALPYRFPLRHDPMRGHGAESAQSGIPVAPSPASEGA